ncbi:MAG: hypothetical protein AVDCRST_MAG76-2603 [uncultured Acidimicrobiales bacterium]|uniref:Uncharacterized protein n=1 Tax=uncultured Acidimicrobiales bacterium TaxID=310071 RepID=A0A6J4IR91_9ACTN|nr:MAG: hypothetical protein AVDCRST_MAG76-2603 [uncultured Acidimicrobiales bacterium]
MAGDASERAYKARALAQAHPLTNVARRFRERAVAQEELDQPMVELARWAGEALLKGYCLRRVEEQDAGAGGEQVEDVTDLDLLEARTTEIAADLRTGDPGRHLFGDPDLTFGALDRIITSELSSRADNYREAVDAAGWRQFEEYIAWWTVRGYALRAAEAAQGASA